MGVLYDDIFDTALAFHRREAENSCLHRASEAAGSVRGLSSAQLNGIVNLAIHAGSVEEITTELSKRNEKRWKSEKSAGPFPQRLRPDILELKKLAHEVVKQTEQALDQAFEAQGSGQRPAGRNWLAELHLALTKRYLTALVGFAQSQGGTHA